MTIIIIIIGVRYFYREAQCWMSADSFVMQDGISFATSELFKIESTAEKAPGELHTMLDAFLQWVEVLDGGRVQISSKQRHLLAH